MPAVYGIQWEPPAITGRYQHLMRRDLAVWERWLAQHGEEFEAVAYDVAVGGTSPAIEGLTDADERGWRYTTALKIDALVRDDQGVWIIEVKPSASVSAIGAAVAYPLVLARDEPELIIAGAGIVAENLSPDLEWIAQQLNIRTWTV